MILETERLCIVPLTVEQFGLLLQTDRMEKELRLSPSCESLDEHTQQAMEGLYSLAVQHPGKYLWYTNWQIILKADNKSIGSACFTGEPNADGQVCIGYGIHAAYRKQGFMTEAATAMCKWALQQRGVTNVIAETAKDNPASHRVLEKCGMHIHRESEESYFWTTGY